MIRRLFRAIRWMFVYGCVATIIAEVLLVSFLARSWHIDRDRLIRTLAVAQGVDLRALEEKAAGEQPDVSREQPSYEQVLETRAVKVRHLELREQALADALRQVAHQERKVIEEKETVAGLKKSFEAELAALEQQAASQGMEDTRAKLTAIKPAQAKLLLDDLLADGEIETVVALLQGMPNTKASKIIGEFKTDKDLENIGEVLRQILEGGALADLAAATARQLQDRQTAKP
jgi:hypothetical protein